MNYRLQWSVATDKGPVRKFNEDSVLVHPEEEELARGGMALPPEGRLCIVADGMGGHRGGQEASSTAVRKITQYYYNQQGMTPVEALRTAIQQTSGEILLFGKNSSGFERMGTTVVLVVSQGDYMYVANVGDSRAYLWRNHELLQLSQDDSWVAYQVRMQNMTPEQARMHQQRNVLMQYLGTDRTVEPHITEIQLQPGDRLLLCTDGVTASLDDAQLCHLIGSMPAHELPGKLLQHALQNGSEDNVTAAVGEYAEVSRQRGRAPARVTQQGRGRWLDARKLVIAFLLMLIGLVVLTLGGILWGTLNNSLFHGSTRAATHEADGTLIIATPLAVVSSGMTISTPAAMNIAPANSVAASPTTPSDQAVSASPATAAAATTIVANPSSASELHTAPSQVALHRAEVPLPRLDIWPLGDAWTHRLIEIWQFPEPDVQECAETMHSDSVGFAFVSDGPSNEMVAFFLQRGNTTSEIALRSHTQTRCVVYGEHDQVQIKAQAERVRPYAFEAGAVYLVHNTSAPVPVFAATPDLAQQPASAAEQAAVWQCGNIAGTNDALVVVSAGDGASEHTVAAVVNGHTADFVSFAGARCYAIDSDVTLLHIDGQPVAVDLEPGAFAIVRAVGDG
jgi:protein phosphatase